MGFIDILKKIEEALSWHWGGKDKVDPNLNPCLLVPGIGGSILHAVSETGHKERIWVRLFAADHEFRSKLYSLYNPKTGRTESLDAKTRIQIPDDRHGLYCCDILDPAVLLRLDTVYYFHDMIKKMVEWGYLEGTTLFGFGYDFRQSNRLSDHMEGLKAKLETIHEASGGKKVDIVTHSMGGLLVKSFLALHQDVFEKYVNSWIAIAAPFQGAPGFIMDCLLTGIEFVKGWQRELFVAKWSMHQLLIECPSVYEMLASPDFDWNDPPELRIWFKRSGSDGEEIVEMETFGPKEYTGVMSAALQENTLDYNGSTIPVPFNKAILEWAMETNKILKSAKLPKGIKFFNIFGTSCETPHHACYGSQESPLEDLSEILNTEAEFCYVDGDGTVPCESASGDFLDAEARVGIPGDHRGILNDDRLFRILQHLLNAGEPDPFYNPFTDYVVIPKKDFEFESHKEERVVVAGSTSVPPGCEREVVGCGGSEDYTFIPDGVEFVATVATGLGSSSDTRAEAHSHVIMHGKHGLDEQELEVATTGVAEGLDKGEALAALDHAMVVASEGAKAANMSGKRVLSHKEVREDIG